MKPGHAFVLGSGIAGLTSAELLSRNGWVVTILETSPEVGGEASRCTQNWLHTGWLYAALPGRSAMLACQRSLQLFRPIYGHLLSPEILNLVHESSDVSYPASARGWFASDHVHYVYELEPSELSAQENRAWQWRLDRVAFQRLRSVGYDTAPVASLSPNLSELLNRWERNADGHARYRVVRSTDAQLNTRRVLDTLLELLGQQTRVVRSARYELSAHNGRSVLLLDGKTHRPDLVLLATGQALPSQLVRIGEAATARKFRSMHCPVVVLKRALDLPNLIRFTPHLPGTVNHIKYDVRGIGMRSTLGSYDYYPSEQRPDISPFLNRIYKRFAIDATDVAAVYYGTKTEFAGPAERRYNHAIQRVNSNTYWAIPGKFSLFPLLAHTLARKLGLRVDIEPASRGALSLSAAATVPEQAFARQAQPMQPWLGTA
jgi:glycine/D-amino acid oxidase-like deaminating enzyme